MRVPPLNLTARTIQDSQHGNMGAAATVMAPTTHQSVHGQSLTQPNFTRYPPGLGPRVEHRNDSYDFDPNRDAVRGDAALGRRGLPAACLFVAK